VVRTKHCLLLTSTGHRSEIELAVQRALRRRAPALALGALGLLGAISGSPALAAEASGEAADDASGSSSQLQEVVVTSRKLALESAISRKEKAEQIVDSVEADDVGKLPDNSITEVLQRVPGVAITHFAAINDPDHYSIEGSGPVVRGLSQVNSTLNGRDSFSANGGRALLWEDVTPELMAGVDVYKTPTPDQIEGGIGGSINLRTHMPFDYKTPEADVTAGYNYGDFLKKGNPSESLLLTDSWQTGVGKFGILVDVARSELQSRSDTFQVEPYYPQLINNSLAYIPGGFDWRENYFDRKRTGLYEAMQWEPTDGLILSQTFFRADYSSNTWTLADYNASAEGFTVDPAGKNAFGSNGGLLSTDKLYFTGWDPLAGSVVGASLAGGDTGANHSYNRTTDYTFSADWHLTDRVRLTSAVQYVQSTAHSANNDVFTQDSIPPFGLDLTTRVPTVTLAPGSTLADPSQSVWEATMDHYEQHKGTEVAWNADLELKLSDDAFLRGLKVGARVANRQEQDNLSNYNWTALSPVWDPVLNHLSTAAPGDTVIATFPNFFRGQATLPSPVALPSVSLVKSFDILGIHQKYGEAGDTQGPTTFNPSTLSYGHTRNEAAYFMLSFGHENVFGLPMYGNIGARVVHYENSATGFIVPPGGTVTLCNTDGTATANCVPTDYPLGSGIYLPNGGGRNYTRALPAFNLQFLLRPDLHLRLAASQSLTNPSFTQMSASGSASFVTQSIGQAKAIIGGTANTGNPNLRPQIATNGDLSLEWYPKPNFETHASLFYKDIHDYLSYGTFNVPVPFAFPNGTVRTLTTAVNGSYNQQQAAIIKGAEFGFQGFADFLPAPWNGLGAQLNYTYIASYAPGDRAFDMLGNPITGLAVDQLSKHNYNLVAMYERNPWSIRLAYTWRSRYLLSTNSNGTASSYNAPTGVTTNPNPIIFSLPVFSDSYGQLDAGVTFRVTENFGISAEGQNLTNAITKTLMGYGNQQYGRNWYIADRRYVLTLRYSFK